ncbi:thiol:disulfide interchange protein [Saprospira grandis DSM 2844]|uniref:Thiol:disulfide interchange protein n=1 Tax=Saprospira grandis DSM 2844 TaxID=694433 RepID=J1I3T2_9BACT|nr:thioredoxin family protein [Saprospira grandis]EJF52993.1 thiol:disulfide interchange protein [Saprospira grandis DSM 2844]
MKRLPFWSLALFMLLTTVPNWAQVIQFEEGQWADILDQAQKEKKMVFVDAYSDCCDSCKWLNKTVFSHPKEGKDFNAHFISYKVDIANTNEPAFIEKAGDCINPSFLFFSAHGELLHKIVGITDLKTLIAESQKALDPNKQLFSLKKRYEKGDRQAEFLRNYILALNAAHEECSNEAHTYLDLIPEKEWLQNEHFDIMMLSIRAFEQKYLDYVLAHKEEFVAENGKEAVEEYMKDALLNQMHIIGEAQNGKGTKSQEYKQLVKKFKQNLPKDLSNYYTDMLNMMIHEGTEKEFKYLNIMLLEHTDSWEELNEAAWDGLYEEKNKKQLKAALKWIDKSIELEENYYNLDTKANLLHKLGKKKEALATAEKALELAKAQAVEAEETKALIEKIKG